MVKNVDMCEALLDVGALVNDTPTPKAARMKPDRPRRAGLANAANVFAQLGLCVVGLGLVATAFAAPPSASNTAAAAGPPSVAVAQAAAPVEAIATPSAPPPSIVTRPDGEASPTVAIIQPTTAPEITAPSPSAPQVTAPPVPVDVTVPADITGPAAITMPAGIAAPTPPVATPATTQPATPPPAAEPPATTAAVGPPPPATAETPEEKGGTPGLKPAKALFGAVATPAPLAARAIGTYAKGCLAGGQALPVDGPAWQAMRLSRNRNWGHPRLVAMVQKLAVDGKSKDGWPGLLVGDLAQPRGGPMLTGHASHQIGLDADIWLTPMPDRTLTGEEREKIEATSMLSEDGLSVARDNWTDGHLKIIKRAASYPEVERILVHPAIKQVLCTTADGDRHWLAKVRPYWGHHYHFHVRIGCPAGSTDCVPQKPVPGDDGCGKELDDWFKLLAKIKPEPAPLPLPGQPPVVAAKPKEKPPTTLDQLPDACRVVLATGNPAAKADIEAAALASKKAVAPTSAAKAAVAGAAAAKPDKPAAVTEKKTAAP